MMRIKGKSVFILAALTILSWPLVLSAQTAPASVDTEIPARPEELTFGDLVFEVPEGSEYRQVLDNGAIAYVVEDHALPLVNLRVLVRQGSYLAPADKVGLASLTGSMMRRGGTKTLGAEAFDEKVEFLAANIGSSGGDTQAGANLNCITPVLDESLDLFFDMLRAPNFEQARLDVEKDNILEGMKQRNDDAGDILGREWDWLLLGEDHYGSRRMKKEHLDRISRQDLVDFHEKYWRPENMIFAVSGDVDTENILNKLNRHIKDWPGEGAHPNWPPPLSKHEPEPGLYHVEKDIPQGKVLIGHLVPQWTDWDNPDRAVIQVMDHILGASGFTSRIVRRVRSDEGLAYSAGSRFGFDPFGPGSFTISFQSKSATVALAAKIALEEVRLIQDEPVSNEELSLAKNSLIDSFPRRFESARQIAGIFAGDAYLDRSHQYWEKWRHQVEAVTAADVQRVAKKYLKPEEMVFLVVGKWDEIESGDADQRANMKEFYGGEVTHLPLRDPLTLEKLP